MHSVLEISDFQPSRQELRTHLCDLLASDAAPRVALRQGENRVLTSSQRQALEALLGADHAGGEPCLWNGAIRTLRELNTALKTKQSWKGDSVPEPVFAWMQQRDVMDHADSELWRHAGDEDEETDGGSPKLEHVLWRRGWRSLANRTGVDFLRLSAESLAILAGSAVAFVFVVLYAMMLDIFEWPDVFGAGLEGYLTSERLALECPSAAPRKASARGFLAVARSAAITSGTSQQESGLGQDSLVAACRQFDFGARFVVAGVIWPPVVFACVCVCEFLGARVVAACAIPRRYLRDKCAAMRARATGPGVGVGGPLLQPLLDGGAVGPLGGDGGGEGGRPDLAPVVDVAPARVEEDGAADDHRDPLVEAAAGRRWPGLLDALFRGANGTAVVSLLLHASLELLMQILAYRTFVASGGSRPLAANPWPVVAADKVGNLKLMPSGWNAETWVAIVLLLAAMYFRGCNLAVACSQRGCSGLLMWWVLMLVFDYLVIRRGVLRFAMADDSQMG